ncbi:MAG: alanine racemase [Planctomycetota bacterium]
MRMLRDPAAAGGGRAPLGSASRAATLAAEAPMTLRSHVHVDTDALRHNARQVRDWAGERQVIAVVKADAYGLGAERCCSVLAEEGVDCMAVANINEAIRLRAIAPTARIVILGEVLAEERERVTVIGAEACVSRLEDVHAFARWGTAEQPVRLHVFVDTGMGRMGCLPHEASAIAAAIQAHPHLRLGGIGTHYPKAFDPVFSLDQESCFEAILDACGPLPGDCLVHVANSAGLGARPTGRANAVRVGLALYGVAEREAERAALLPVVSWHSCITLIKDLPAGHNVSYELTWRCPAATVVAIVPIGYADGYPTTLSHKASVLVHGRRCRVLGRVTMDYLVVDITGLERPQHGDEVIIMGRQGEELIRAEELAEQAGLIPYEILTSLNKRYRDK